MAQTTRTFIHTYITYRVAHAECAFDSNKINRNTVSENSVSGVACIGILF